MKRLLFCRRLVLAAMVTLASWSAMATDWYLVRKENSGSMNTWYDALYWKTLVGGTAGVAGEPLNPDDTYYVRWAYYVRAKPKGGVCEFTGKVLSIGYTDYGQMLQECGNAYTTHFRNDGLILKIGDWIGRCANQTSVIDGNILVTAPGSKPFRILSEAANTTFDLQTALSGASGTALQVGVGISYVDSHPVIGADGFGLKLSCDCSAYYGSIVVTSLNAAVSSAVGTTLTLATNALPGSVSLTPKTKFVVSSATGATVGSLAVTEDTVLDLSAGTPLVVTTAFTKRGDEKLPVAVTVTDDAFDDWSKTNRFVILTMPFEAEVSEDDFEVSGISGTSTYISEQGTRIVNNGDGTKSLVAEFGPIVYQTVVESMDGNQNYKSADASSLTHADHWSDGELPHGGAHYVTAKEDGTNCGLNTPGPKNSTYEFVGDSLTANSIHIFESVFSVPVMRMLPNAYIAVGNGVPTCTITGGRFITKTKLSSTTYAGCTLKIASELEGDAEIWVGRKGGTGSPQANTEFTGTNLNFKGSFYIGQNVTPTFNQLYQTLYVSDERNLGGKIDSFKFNALGMDSLSRLYARESFTLTTNYNRGVKIGSARFYADAGKTIGIRTQMTMSGKVWKEGDGVLDLGGTVKFYNSNTKQPQDAVISGKNDLVVTGGVLRVSSAYAVNGLNLDFGPGTKLVVKLDPSDAEFTEKGAVDVKTDTPIALNAALAGKLPIEIGSDVEVRPGEEYGLLTVSSAAADAVAAMLPKYVLGLKLLKGEVIRKPANDDGSVTFAVSITKPGTMLLVK